MSVIEVRDVSRLYRRGVDLVHALEHVTLRIPGGRFVALMRLIRAVIPVNEEVGRRFYGRPAPGVFDMNPRRVKDPVLPSNLFALHPSERASNVIIRREAIEQVIEGLARHETRCPLGIRRRRVHGLAYLLVGTP